MTFRSFSIDSTFSIQLSDLGPSYSSSNRTSRSPTFMSIQNTDLILSQSEVQSPVSSVSSESSIPENSHNSASNNHFYNDSEISQDPVLLNPNLYLYAPNDRQKLRILLTRMPLAIPHWLWEADDQTDDCFDCRRDFNIFNRRHHCRRCGIIYCDSCSSSKALLGNSINEGLDGEDYSPGASLTPRRCVWTKRADLVLSRVCHTCSNILQDNETVSKFLNMKNSCGVYLEVNTEGLMISTFDDLSLQQIDEKSSEMMLNCPACHLKLSTIGDSEDQEAHVAHCLKKGMSKPNFQGNSTLSFILPDGGEALYVPYRISEKDSIVDQECQICLDVFRVGDEAARLSCFCCYHLLCAKDWFQRCPTCPTHGL